MLKQKPVINLLHVPRLAAGKQDKPAIHELVENVPHDVKIEQAWIGEGFSHSTRLQRRRNVRPGACSLRQRRTGFHGIRRRRPENAQGSQELIRSTAAERNFALREMSIYERLRKEKETTTLQMMKTITNTQTVER